MLQCNFELNSKPMSKFTIGATSFSAFSGLGKHINNRSYACLPGLGPIPPGTYYIVNRESGGIFGTLWDRIKNRHNWFALYAIDGKIDDATFCNHIERGNFRLHPKGLSGISKGCIVIDSISNFNHLSAMLRGSRPETIPGTEYRAFGKVAVR